MPVKKNKGGSQKGQPKQYVPESIKVQIHKEFMAGRAPKDLSAKEWIEPNTGTVYKVPTRTIDSWRTAGLWAVKKEKFVAIAQKNIFEQYRQKIEEISSKCLDGSRILVHIALEEMDFIRKKYPEAGKRDPALKPLEAWAKIMTMGSTIQRNALPEFPEEIAQQMLKRLEETNKIREEELRVYKLENGIPDKIEIITGEVIKTETKESGDHGNKESQNQGS